jgi:hypothetical protein
MTAMGKCYTDTLLFGLRGSKAIPYERLVNMDKVEIVHGTVVGKTGKRIDHAWVELSYKPYKWVWESQHDRLFNASEYYKSVGAKVDYRLTIQELMKLREKFKNCGPFTKKELASIKK